MSKLQIKILVVTKDKTSFFNRFAKKNKKISFVIKNPTIKKDLKYLKTYNEKKNYLFSFAGGYIFNKSFLSKFKKCYNFHPSTPNYRGRDTHHFACLNKESFFGGTLHLMNNKIDKGKIIKVYKKKISYKNRNHKQYLKVGINCIKALFINQFNNLISENYTYDKKNVWSDKMYTRKMFLEKFYIKKKISLKYYNHLFDSLYDKKYSSLFIIKNSKKIYLNKRKDYYKIINNFL